MTSSNDENNAGSGRGATGALMHERISVQKSQKQSRIQTQIKDMALNVLVLFMLCFCATYGFAGVTILKPGPCPTLGAHPELDWSKITGDWKVLELPKSVSCPCNGDIHIFIDKITQEPKEVINDTSPASRSLSPSWTRMTVSAPVCRNPEKHGRSLHWELDILQNPARAGIAVVRPPYPWDLFGFGSLTIIATDYTTYAVLHFCHSLLLEHASLPLLLIRSGATLDLQTISRLHFSLELQGLSTWDMENVKDATCDTKQEVTPDASTLTPIFVDSSTDTIDMLTSYFSTVNITLLQTLATTLVPLDVADSRASDDQIEFQTEQSLDYNPKDDAEWLGTEFYGSRHAFDDNPMVFPFGSESESGLSLDVKENVPFVQIQYNDWKPALQPIPPNPQDGKMANLVVSASQEKEKVDSL